MADEAMNPGERSLRARIGAYAMHGRNDAGRRPPRPGRRFLLASSGWPIPRDGCRLPSGSAAPSSCAALTSPGSRSPRPRPAAPAGQRSREVKAPPARIGRKRAERV